MLHYSLTAELFAHGAHPSQNFACMDKSKTISRSAINDDYCDCSDGSDEPGTCALDAFAYKWNDHLTKPHCLRSCLLEWTVLLHERWISGAIFALFKSWRWCVRLL